VKKNNRVSTYIFQGRFANKIVEAEPRLANDYRRLLISKTALIEATLLI
jgi:hypothetical protein